MTNVGNREVGLIASSEHGKTTTVISCNVAESFIPPFMTFGRKKMNSRLLKPGTKETCTDNGSMAKRFCSDLDSLLKLSDQLYLNNKVFLVLDDHESHVFAGLYLHI